MTITAPVFTRADLIREGLESHAITEAVRSGALLRVRRGWYARPDVDDRVAQAVRVGGRLTCTAALESYGVWVTESRFAHVALPHHASRLRHPRDRRRPLPSDHRDGVELHWWPLLDSAGGDTHRVALVDALAQTVRCADEFTAIAALDSALNQRLIDRADLADIRGSVPLRCRRAFERVDGRCMSGLETALRLLLTDAGIPFELQRAIPGVGTVDFVVGGRIVIETDGERWHAGDAAERDYDRDFALAQRGYIVLRLRYRHLFGDARAVLEAIRALLAFVDA